MFIHKQFSIVVLLLALVLAGCVSHTQRRVDISDLSNLGKIDVLNAAPQQEQVQRRGNRSIEVYDEFTLAHVEFDDQGKYWKTAARPQIDVLEDYVDSQIDSGAYSDGAMVIVFVHGWFNNAKEGNYNLQEFRTALLQLKNDVAGQRPVLGIYLSWRGASLSVPGAKFLSYWNRKKIAHNVGRRDLGEAVTRIAEIRKQIIERAEGLSSSRNAKTRLVLVGHSFGGAALFSASSRFMEDELIALENTDYQGYIARRWDLLVLANPAFEALRYEGIDRHIQNMLRAMMSGTRPGPFAQLPRLFLASSRNDTPNQVAMPVGQTLANLFAARQSAEWPMMTKPVGNYPDFFTHRLDLADDGETALLAPVADDGRMGEILAQAAGQLQNQRRDFLDPFKDVFAHPDDARGVLPCMVATVDKRIINGHGGIWSDEFRNFLVKFIVARENAAAR